MIEMGLLVGAYYQAATAATALAKRDGGGDDAPVNLIIPYRLWVAFAINLIVFVPLMFYVSYTLNWLYPLLAMVEDPNPPAYEPVPLDDEEGRTTTSSGPKIITSSVRAINRLLYSVGGLRANFRGMFVGFIYVLATLVVGAFTGLVIPASLATFSTLPVSLALAPLSTLWLHTAIRGPNPNDTRHWYRRFPAFRKTFEATCFPILLNWASIMVASYVPLLVARALGVLNWDLTVKQEIPSPSLRKGAGAAVWQVLVVFIIALALHILLVLPSRVMLVRVQASLLPPDEDVIVPFDRSFQGKVQPEVVNGKGWAGMRDALSTFDRASWIRLYVLYAKVFALTILSYIFMAVIIIPEFALLRWKQS